MLFASKGSRLMRWFFLLLALMAVLEMSLIGHVLVSAKLLDAPRPCDAMLVLGSMIDTETGEPKKLLSARLDRAEQLSREGYAPVIVVSGGTAEDYPCSEAFAMKRYLMRDGIPEDVIFMEDRSRNTEQNIRFSKEILVSQGRETVLIVSSGFHLWRAREIARKYGLAGIASASSGNGANPFSVLVNCARETLSRAKFLLMPEQGD